MFCNAECQACCTEWSTSCIADLRRAVVHYDVVLRCYQKRLDRVNARIDAQGQSHELADARERYGEKVRLSGDAVKRCHDLLDALIVLRAL